MTVVRLIARPMLASMFVYGGVNSLRNAVFIASRAAPIVDKIAPVANKATGPLPVEVDATTLVRLNGATQVVAGLALATGRQPRLAALALAGSLVPTTLAGHRFWEESDPAQRTNQTIHFIKNLSMMGGVLLASVDTSGKPSVAWRVRRNAKKLQERAAR